MGMDVMNRRVERPTVPAECVDRKRMKSHVSQHEQAPFSERYRLYLISSTTAILTQPEPKSNIILHFYRAISVESSQKEGDTLEK